MNHATSHATSHATAPAPVVIVDPYEDFLSHLSRKSLASVEAHLQACQAASDLNNGRQWKRVAALLGKLASHAIEASGQHVLRFYIADGKYRQQVFTLDDSRKGTISVYLPDVLDAAFARKLIVPLAENQNLVGIPGLPAARVPCERITTETKDLPPHCRPMLGWGRRALRVTVAAVGDDHVLTLVGQLAGIAAESWKIPLGNPAPAVSPTA